MSQQRLLLGNSEPESSSSCEQSLRAACEQSEQPEEPAPMHNGLTLAVWIKESEQLSSLAYSQTDYIGHFCHVLVAFKQETVWLDKR